MDERTAAIVSSAERYDELSRLAREAGFFPFRADAADAAATAREGECALVVSDSPREELEGLPVACVVVGSDGRLSRAIEPSALSALGGLECVAHAVARKFSELAARQEDIRKHQARISDFLTAVQDSDAPKELVDELAKLREESGGFAEALERLQGALAEAREGIDELLRIAAERGAGEEGGLTSGAPGDRV